MRRLPAVLLGSVVLLAPGPGLTEPLGKLFFTPEQRAQLDAERRAYDPRRGPPPSLGGATEAPPAAPTPPVVPEIAPTRVTVNGLIRSSDGRAMVWLNNQMQELPSAATGGPARVRIAAPDGRPPMEVKVGQSYLSNSSDSSPQSAVAPVSREERK